MPEQQAQIRAILDKQGHMVILLSPYLTDAVSHSPSIYSYSLGEECFSIIKNPKEHQAACFFTSTSPSLSMFLILFHLLLFSED